MRRMLSAAVVLATLFAASAAHAWTWPVDGPVLRPYVLGDDPYAGGQHRGLDIGGDLGASVRAPAAGTVSFAGVLPGGVRGVTVRTADGYAVTLLQLGGVAVAAGATVAEGQVVGAIGESRDTVTTRPHVHLGIRHAADEHGYVDPLTLLPQRPAPPPPPPPEPVEPTPAPAPVPVQPPTPPAAVAEPDPAPASPHPPASPSAPPAAPSGEEAVAPPVVNAADRPTAQPAERRRLQRPAGRRDATGSKRAAHIAPAATEPAERVTSRPVAAVAPTVREGAVAAPPARTASRRPDARLPRPRPPQRADRPPRSALSVRAA